MKHLFLFLAVVGGLFFSGRALAGAGPGNVTELYGEQGLEILRHAETVSAVLLDDKGGKITERTKRVALSADAVKSAVALITAHESYAWGRGKRCHPVFGCRLIFQRGEKVQVVDFCFSCLILKANSPGGGKGVLADFDPAEQQWLELFKTRFPKDKRLHK